MKFFIGILLVALVAFASAEEVTKDFKPVPSPSVTDETEATEANARSKRGFILSSYAAPGVPIARPAFATPYAYTYSASLTPYAYSAYNTYAPYHPYPAFYY